MFFSVCNFIIIIYVHLLSAFHVGTSQSAAVRWTSESDHFLPDYCSRRKVKSVLRLWISKQHGLGESRVNTLLLFETDCVNIHRYDSLFMFCTWDWRLNDLSKGRNSQWFIYPTLNGPWGRTVVWIWPTSDPSKFPPTEIWTRDQCTTSGNSNHCGTLSYDMKPNNSNSVFTFSDKYFVLPLWSTCLIFQKSKMLF